VSIQATQIRIGMVILMDGQLFKVLERHHHTPGNLRGMVQTKLRRLATGALHEHRFRSVDMVEKANLERREMEYLYDDAAGYHFMDGETYEQVALSKEDLGETINYLTPNVKFDIEMYEGRAIGVEPPLTVELKVIKTDPRLKGATASNQNKPALLETGLTVAVPPFIEEGEVVRIDTREGAYLERVK
jgi:elongation factor P